MCPSPARSQAICRFSRRMMLELSHRSMVPVSVLAGNWKRRTLTPIERDETHGHKHTDERDGDQSTACA
jgi:hypothetical protein